MKALFVTSPGDGHVLPVVASAWELRNQGHEVIVATAGTGVAAASQAGLSTIDVAPDADLGQVRRRHLAGMGTLSQDERFLAAMVMFGEISALMVDGAVDVATAWQPDVVIHTPLQAAGPVVAASADAALVEHGFQLTGVLRTMELLLPHMAGALQRHGLRAEELPRAHGLDVCPPALQSYRRAGVSMGFRPYNGGGVVPAALLRRGDCPRVCLTLGTSLPADVLDRIRQDLLSTCAVLGVEVILATGAGTDAGTHGANVVAEGWLPLTTVLPTCDLVVHHGGAGTTLTAAWSGAPQVIIPQLADQHFNAAQITRAGIGTAPHPSEVTAESVLGLMTSALDGSRAEACQLVARQMRTAPPPSEVLTSVLDRQAVPA